MENSWAKRNFSTRVRLQSWVILFNIVLRYFNGIESIRETIDFPSREAFFSKLTQSHCDEELYHECRKLYESRLNLPDDHPDKWFNMSCYLKHYNLLDVSPLKEALLTCFSSFKNYFLVDPGNWLDNLSSIKYELSIKIEFAFNSISKYDESLWPFAPINCFVCKRD